nr:MAG TPA: tail protein [Caudoviricetes sp.]
MATEDNLRDRAKEIRGAFEPSSVTNEAVGGLLLDIINFFIDYGGNGGGGGKPDARYWSKEELKMLDQYLYVLNDKIKALYADSAGDSELFKGHKWEDYFDQPVRKSDAVEFNSVTSTDFESKLKGWVIDALGNAEFRDVLLRSFKSWNFAAGPLGAGVGMVNDDELQTDKLLVRKIMYVLEMMIQRMRFQGGIMVLSPATGFKIDRVETFDTYYRVYCRPEDFNEFEVNDQARIQNFTGNNIKYLWSLVLSRGDDYIDISRVDKDGDGVPAEGDEIVQLGNRTNPDRQDAVLLSAVNGEVGIFTYYGINNFDLSSKEGSWLGKHGGKKGAVIRGEVHITAGSSGLEQFDEYEDVDKRIQDAKDLADSVQDVVNNLTSIIIPDIQGQIDGSIMSHEGKVPPTLTNEPAVNWTTEEEKNRHLGDYYDYFLTVDGEQVTERYKFSKVNGAYQWVRVADSGSALAASVAREALGLAGTKATITWGNTLPEAPYNINDMWIKLDGSMYICNHQRLDGETGSQSDWQLFNDTMLRLAKMADDNVITKEEKATLRDTWNQIQKEFTAYQAQATKYGVSITALQNAYNTLNTFLTNTVKLSRDDEDTNLSVAQKTEYNQDFANYYSERTAFANVIAQKVADDSVGNLQIGGINLADYSGGDFLDVLGLYSGDRQYASKTTIDGKACLQYNNGSKNMRFAPVKVENAIYTFSIWVKGSEEYDAQVNHYNGSNYGSTTVHVTTSWERKVITFTAKAGSDIIHFGTKNTIYITDWKYEKGNKATDWSPSIADQNRLSREIAKAEAELAETKANAYADGIVTEAEQNAINEAQARLDALKIGSVNLVSKKMMLAWNEKNKDIAVWGQDSDGIYLAINQGLLYNYVCGGAAHNDLFGGTIKYKDNTQYVFQVKWKLAGEQTNNNSGVSFWALYTDGTTDGIRLGSLQTSLIVESLITKKGKTVEKIFSSYGDNVYRSLIYSLALYGGNKVLSEPPVATEDLTGQSNVNLVDGGKEVTVESEKLNYEHKSLLVPKLKPNTVYYLSFKAEMLKGSLDTYSAYLYNEDNSTGLSQMLNSLSGGIMITNNNFTEGSYSLLLYAGKAGSTFGHSVKYTDVMLVEGFTPPSSYSPSPGDVAKDIKDVSDAVSSLQNFTDQAFADGIITRSEAQAIASNINVLNAEKADIGAYYTKLYANAYLTGTAKTNLASAKTAYNTAHTKLIDSINTAIADGKTTATEKADVDDKFSAYNNALSAYQTRVGEANKAIQDQIKALAEQDATNKVNGIQIGARNLLLNSGVEVTNGAYNIKNYETSIPLLPGKKYTVVIKGTTTGGQTLGLWFNGGSNGGGMFPSNMTDEVAFIHTTSPSVLNIKDYINFYNYPSSGSAANPATIKWACLYEGHVKPPMDWVQAPEDIDKAIQDSIAKTVDITAPSQVFKYGPGYTGTPTPSSIVLTATPRNFTPTSYQWQFLNGSTWINITIDGASSTYSVNPNSTTLFPSGTNVRTFRCICNGDEKLSDSFTLAKLADGATGQPGADGRGVKSTAVTYQSSTSGTTVPTGTWSASIPAVAAGSYLWTKTVITYTSGDPSTMYSVARMGTNGTNGNNGNGVSSTVITYQASTSGTTAPTGTWGSTIPSVPAGQYLWTRTVINYTNGSSSTIYSVGMTGKTGADGKDAYTILLGNESHAFAGSTAAALAGSTTCSVVAYKGATRVAATIGTISGLPTGMTASVASNGTTTPVITFTVTTSMTTASGTVNIPVTVDGKTFTKVFSYSIAFRGDPGESINGKMLYKDPEFKKGLNGVEKYTNSSNVSPDYIASKLTVERVTKPSDAPTQSGYCLKITCKAAQSPGYGGVYQSITSRANAVFVQKIIAKIPVGYQINTASNSMGTGYTDTWLTPTKGTGKYTTYLRKVVCGTTGNFSTGGHVYINGSPAPTESAPLEWYIAYMTAFDLTADGYGDIEFSAKDDLAQQLGYSNFDKMVENASKGETIIKGAYINTKLIDVETLVADTALVDKLIGRELNFTLGSVGGFKMESTLLYSGAKFGTGGAGIAMQSMTNNYGFNVYKDNNNYVEMFQRSSEWGLKGVVNGSPVFQFGSTNKIGPFSYTGNLLVADNPYMLENGYKYDGGLVLSPNHIYFKYAMGSIYQQSVYIGVKGEHGSSSYGDNTVLGVEGGDIWHQAGDFYASNIRLRGDMDVYNNSIIRMKGQIHFDNVVTYTGSGAVTITADSGHFIYLTPITGNPVVSVSSGLPIGSWFIIAHATTAGGYYYIKLSGSDRFRRRGNAYQQVNSNNQDPSLIFKVNNTTWIIGNLPVNWIDWN